MPMSHGNTLSKKQYPTISAELESMDSIPYASAIGSIMYAMTRTCFDVALMLSKTSKDQSNPAKNHWIAVKNILKYLRNT